VAWWWIAATDPALDDQAAVAEDGLTAGLGALACVVVRAVTPDATCSRISASPPCAI